jgi:4-hydroxy-3-polyprenylbenzoate decarboxylase
LAYNDLREWIAALERAGELRRIKTEVDPVLEIAEITDRVSKGNFADESARATLKPGGPAYCSKIPRAVTFRCSSTNLDLSGACA